MRRSTNFNKKVEQAHRATPSSLTKKTPRPAQDESRLEEVLALV